MWRYDCLSEPLSARHQGFVNALFVLDRCYFPLVEIPVQAAFFIAILVQAVRHRLAILEKPLHEELGVFHRKVKWICVAVFVVCVVELVEVVFWERSVPTFLEIVLYCSQSLAWLTISIALQREEAQQRAIFHHTLQAWWVVNLVLSALTVVAESVVGKSLLNTIFDYVPLVSSLFIIILCFKSYVYVTIRKPLASVDSSEFPLQDDIPIQQSRWGFSGAALWSVLSFSWLNPLLAVGNEKPLVLSDVPLFYPADGAAKNFDNFQECWHRSTVDGTPPSLLWVLIRIFWQPFMWSLSLTFVYSGTMFIGPVLQNLLINFMEEKHREFTTGATLVFILFSGKIVEALSVHQFGFRSRKLGLLMWAAVGQAVYEKSLRLSVKARQARSVGEITNIFSADVQRLQRFSYYLQQGLALPLQLIVAVLVLFDVVGVAMVTGLLTLVTVLVINFFLVRKLRVYRKGQLQAKDKRMQATTECLGNMKVIKLQAWDEMFKSKIEQLRELERKWVEKFMNNSVYINVMNWTGPLAVSAVTFLTMVLLRKPLTTARVFTAMTTFRIIQEPIRFIPEVISNCIQATVSCQRIGAFLMEEEVDEAAVMQGPSDSACAVEIERASFAWDEAEGILAIKDLTLSIKKGTCVAICGAVGSGKSSLLYSIMGDLPRLSGKAQVSGRIAYVAQTAWIQNDSIQENILFGCEMDPKRYNEVIRMCGLKTDLAQFPDGDQTEIGERGINLSGGQKQRVQLARAVYQDADTYILDDPFSAVDAHTGTFLFDECVKGALKDKTVILVTHQVEFLPEADMIIVMKAPGEVAQQGTYSELLEEGKDFGSLVDALQNSLHSVSEATLLKSDELPDITLDTKLLDLKLSETKLSDTSSKVPKSSKLGIAKGKLIQDEMRGTGRVDLAVAWRYVTKFRGGVFCLVILMVQALTSVCQISSDSWLGMGTSESGKVQVSDMRLIEVYSLFVAVCSITVFVSRRVLAYVGVATAQAFFSDMLSSIVHAPMSFLDSTPTGRILSRSSTDQSTLDMDLPTACVQTSNQMFGVLGSLLITIYVTPMILILIIPLGFAFVHLQNYYINSSRELSRLTALMEAPVFLHISESIAGATTIRAFQQEARFGKTSANRLEAYQRASFHNAAATEWLGLRLDNLAAGVLSAAAILLISLPEGSVNPGLAGLSLSYGLTMSGFLMRLVTSASMAENFMVSVERISQYSSIPSEAATVILDSRPPSGWPNAGKIELQDLKIRYRADTPLVLKGVSCVLEAGEKVGVVGRTGSGKSTLIQALFRLLEPSGGCILIDGIDINTIGLNDLRSVLGVIPQEPTLFQGTVRSNLDPFNLCTDEQIWESLDKCQLGREIRDKAEKLDASVSEQGENWSVGQRQLLCLGRALLKHPRILVLDEATASVDITTDAVIQNTIKQHFADCTVISVAHRISTVIDSDRVLVLDAGILKENDSPEHLLADESSMFSKLVQEYTQRSRSNSINIREAQNLFAKFR